MFSGGTRTSCTFDCGVLGMFHTQAANTMLIGAPNDVRLKVCFCLFSGQYPPSIPVTCLSSFVTNAYVVTFGFIVNAIAPEGSRFTLDMYRGTKGAVFVGGYTRATHLKRMQHILKPDETPHFVYIEDIIIFDLPNDGGEATQRNAILRVNIFDNCKRIKLWSSLSSKRNTCCKYM